MDQRLVDKVFSFTVDVEGQPMNKKFDLDKNVKLIHGIVVSSNMPNLLFYRGSQRLEISGDEIFPEDFESKLLMSGIAVPPDQKYRRLGNGVISGNGEVKLQYRDTVNPNAPFTPYKVTITLQCELKS
jgi:hypothetical protein